MALSMTGCALPLSSSPPAASDGHRVHTRTDIDVAHRALPTLVSNVEQPAHYQHVYIDPLSPSAGSLQTITLDDAVKHGVLASSDFQTKPLSKIDPDGLKWSVLERGYKRPTEIEGVGGVGIENNNFAEVNFDLNQTDILNPDHLTKLITKAGRVSGVFHVVGYADESGIESRNLKLSAERAQAVAQALTSAGVNRSRVVDSGAGVSRLYPGLRANRRASVTLLIAE